MTDSVSLTGLLPLVSNRHPPPLAYHPTSSSPFQRKEREEATPLDPSLLTGNTGETANAGFKVEIGDLGPATPADQSLRSLVFKIARLSAIS